MKKIGGKSFWIILVISIIFLIALSTSVILLTRKNSKEFYSAGYIISSTSTKSDKLYFDDNTVYKENVFNEYVFKNTDNKEVTTDKNNFIHYLDNSLSFMKNGVILDLDNISTSLVPYYNITDKSIIKYNNGGYYIETNDKTLVFGNFLGKITDNKYIVVGNDIKIKLAGSNEAISGKYFEILFVEDGIVKIENQEGSYQTVSDGSIIYVGDNIKINLGDKNVYLGDDSKLSLGEMTIDGNENIDITPSDGKVKDDNKGNNGGNGTGTDGNNGGNSGIGGDNSGNGQNGNNTGNDGTNGDKTVIKKEVSVDLISAKSGIDTISASFQVIDTDNFIKGNLVLSVVNSDTGDTVYRKILANTSDIQDVNISSLASDSNYVMTISEENNTSGIQYFKKIFKTDNLGISLVPDVFTTDSLSYSVDFGNTDVKSVNISLYDKDNNQIGDTTTIYSKSDAVAVFEGLESNTTYTARVDSVVFNNLNYANTYNFNTSDSTLKKRPTLGDISVSVSDDGKEFTLSMEKPEDVDKSISQYIYEIYRASDITEDNLVGEPVYSFSAAELKDQKLKLGDNNLTSNVDYRFRIVVKYYDNYKYNQIETAFSNYFQIVGKPTIEFTPNDEVISFNQIGGKITIKDEGCTIPNDGRSCFDKINNFSIKYYGPDRVKKNIDNVKFVTSSDGNSLVYDMLLGGLTESTLYTFEVYADIDMQNGEGLRSGEYIGSFTSKTKGTKALMMKWSDKDNDYTFDTPISVNTELTSVDPEDDSIDKLSSITFNLYIGNVKNVALPLPIGSFTTTENIRELYYNKSFALTSNMFGIENLDKLRELSGGRLSRQYTIEVTDAFDETGTNEFKILDNMYVFNTPSLLLLEDEVSTPEITVSEITNTMLESGEYSDYDVTYDNRLDKTTVVGYKVTASFDRSKIERIINVDNSIRNVTFYAYDSKGNVVDTKPVSLEGTDPDIKIAEAYFFLGYGTDNSITDKDLRRGNTYRFGFDIKLDTDDDGKVDSSFPANKPLSNYFNAMKKDPSFRMYIYNSSANSITYKYMITDVDNALVKDSDMDNYLLYYSINDNNYSSVISKSEEFNDVTLSNLNPSDIYTISYSRVSLKGADPSLVTLNKYFFDGYHDGKSASLKYSLVYGNFDNRLKIVLEDNDFLDRVSTYLLTLSSGNDKYEKVLSNFDDLDSCDGTKCFIIDYAEITKSDKNSSSIDLKGKDVKVSLVAFYDTGYVGFGQESKIGSYFEGLGLVDSKNSNLVGFVYQGNGNEEKGKYIYIKKTGDKVNFIGNSDKPVGILSSKLITNNELYNKWKIVTSNLVDIDNNKFIPFGDISSTEDGFSPVASGIFRVDVGNINLKVLDMLEVPTDNNNFKFTSFTPKVKASTSSLINGGIFNIDLSVDEDTLKSDFVNTDGKYKFYIDIYKKTICDEEDTECEVKEEFVKTEPTDYDNLSSVTVTELEPDTEYIYYISADMNKSGKKFKTRLFDFNKYGYVEYKNSFRTLNRDLVLKSMNVNYTSSNASDNYSKRFLNIDVTLRTKTNMNIMYEIYDINNELKYTGTINNEDIMVTEKGTIIAKFSQDISGNDFVFGANYYTLKVYAVTTDLNKKLELYNDNIKQVSDGIININVPELLKPSITVNKQEAIISTDYKHSIKYKITVIDSSRVIQGGKYYIELQNTSYQNVCTNENDCIVDVDMKNGTCQFRNGKSCSANFVNNGLVVEAEFTDLKANTNYNVYAEATTYRNNVSLSDDDKTSIVYARKSQFTKSDLGFSLGDVTPTAVGKNRVLVTFVGAANINTSLKGIVYNIVVQGGERVASGTIGRTLDGGSSDITFTLDSDKYPYIAIDIPDGKELGENNTINITYYYVDSDGKMNILNLGGKTVFDYTFSIKNK